MLCKCYKHVGKKHQGNIFITSTQQVQESINKLLCKCYVNVINTWGRNIKEIFL